MKIDISGIEFPLTLDLQNAKLFGTIPASLVTPMLLKEIDKYDNYSLRDTEFDRWRTNDSRIRKQLCHSDNLRDAMDTVLRQATS